MITPRHARWRAFSLLFLAAAGAACSGTHRGAPLLGVGDGGPGHDAALSDGSVDAADVAQDASGEAGDEDPEAPVDCSPRFDALDATCQSDDDCVRVVQNTCGYAGNGLSRVLGIASSDLDDFQALAEECELPRPSTSSEECPGEGGGLSSESAQEGELEQTGNWPIVVRCDAGRCRSHRAQCEPELCGNGELDGCDVMESAAGVVFTPHPLDDAPEASEECDGDELLPGRSCEAEGFGSGEMRCLEDVCAIDDAACSPCLEPAGALTACVSDALDAADPSSEVGIAASATEIAIAFADGPVVRIARFDGELERLGEVSFRVSEDDLFLISNPRIAPYPDGFILVLDVGQLVVGQGVASEDVAVYALRPDGSHEGLIGMLPGARGALLVAREGGTPLLLALRPTAIASPMLSAVAIAEDGSGFDTVTDLGPVFLRDAVFAGDGYLLALQSSAAVLALQRVGLDGAMVGEPVQHPGAPMEAALIAGESGVRILYTETGQTFLATLTREGAVLGAPQPVAAVHPSLGARILAWGSDLIVTESMGNDTRLMRIDSALELTPITAVTRHPSYGSALALFAFGDHVVVAIRGTSGSAQTALTLAAVTP